MLKIQHKKKFLVVFILCITSINLSCNSVQHIDKNDVRLETESSTADKNISTRAESCYFDSVNFDRNFSNARLNSCTRSGENDYFLSITPENTPINDSPWYAFKVHSKKNQTLEITLEFIDGTSRYLPKISRDGISWSEIPHIKAEKNIQFALSLEKESVWIAGQEIITNDVYERWLDSISEKEFISKKIIGESILRQPISIATVNKENRDVVVLMGRQHPPEITGTLAFFPFVETLLSNSMLATQYRERFQTIVIPNVNPDGVTLGNWRHNANGIDTNRDWGIFTQPETMAIKKYLASLSPNHTFYLGLDFHSTGKNYFYTQKDNDVLCPQDFTASWINNIAQKRPTFEFKRSARSSNGNPTFKQWFNTAYNVPSISYEMGDNTNRDTIKDIAVIAAEEMMRELLASQCPTTGQTMK